MEGDTDTVGGGGGGGGSNPPEGKLKVKRKMKTASQLETLENTYAVETYPSESIRAELSTKLELSDRQLQTWFRQRRLKDRKATPVKLDTSSAAVNVVASSTIVGEEKGHYENVSGSGLLAHVDSQRAGVAGLARIGGPKRKRYYKPPQAISELRAFDFVEVQLGEPLREDGPILGMEFDPLPPGAFGAPIAPVGEQKSAERSNDANLYELSVTKNVKVPPRTVHEYQFLPEQPSIKSETYERAQSSSSRYYGSPIDRSSQHGSELVSSGYGFHSPIPSLSLVPHHDRQHSGEYNILPRKCSLSIAGMDADENVAQIERKRKIEEARIAKEAEVQEKRIRKELERQDILRRKTEEHMKKEMERQDRERRKEEERLLREKLREEERYQREQRREMERREKLMQNESQRAEKMKLKEELRREKEVARLKVASDRATARRMAKESTELIDDERLELLELAALSRGLPSILSLDTETIENLEFLRDKLPAFPPQSVHMKKPFAIQPWTDSEENIGNLLMVWRFLITFADVLGLWPFTLDEFVQAFHDYDSRLLGEIHISLLRSIIKDVEDVARTPTTGFGSNQNTTANLSGGHPHIVEGAYEWGFDIRSWQHHLNPLTWPEILRQFALSAGFGPKLKKRTTESSCHQDESEDNNSEDIIYKLRTGAAAQNAFAIMQERGFANPKRSRHRLTPGTVKFAAFHVLSLEGSKGLAILEVADRIQKSGLRNLTTSRTPEASVAAALSRDTKLFERTAPSTYCVRSPYRKDPIDADMILSAAREKIQMFTNGYFDGEEADDVEPDKDSESDVAEDPDADELVTTENKARFGMKTPSGIKTPESGPKDEKTAGQSIEVAETCLAEEVHLVQDDNTVMDESIPGETWVQGLTEGEYSDLSVLERLNALVSLISVANEGNSVRAVLEERLEAANSLKKQMWAEAQLDKRRIKEEFVAKIQYSSFSASKVEQNHLVIAAEDEHAHDLPNNMNMLSVERNPPPQATDFLTNTNNISHQHTGFAAEKSQLQLKAYIGHKAEEMYVYRSLPLGQDRRRNRYWRFVTSASQNDPGSGKLFIELRDGSWRLIDSEEDFDSLLGCLDLRGIRESHLHSMLQKIEGSFKESGRKKTKLKEDAFRRYQEFEKWTCEECTNPSLLRATKNTDMEKKRKQLLGVCNECMELYLSEDIHCPSCHLTFRSSINDIEFAEHAMKCNKEDNPKWDLVKKWKSNPLLKNTLLKVLLASIEMSVPTEALQPAWLCDYRNSCGMELLSASSTEDILKILTLVEGAIRRDSLSSCYQTTNELLGCGETIFSHPETISVLPWIPPTTSAVALRLMELDASILYVPGQPVDSHKDNKMTFPSRFVLAKNIPQDNGVDHLTDPKIHGKGRWRGHIRGGRSKRKAKSEAAARRRRSTKTDRLGLKGKAGHARRSKGGPTTSSTMQKSIKVGDISGHKNIIQPPQETVGIQPKTSLEHWDYNNDYNGQATNDELLVANGYVSMNGVPDPLGGHHLEYANMEIEEDEHVEREAFENHAVDSDEDDDGQGDNDVERYINDDSENENEMNRDDYRQQQTNNMDENKEEISTSSSDYSD